MINLKKADWTNILPLAFPAEKIYLPTNGFEIYSLDCIKNRVSGEISYYSMRGLIHPVDEVAPDIEFQINLPLVWNGISIQYGGAGFDGALEAATGVCAGQPFVGATPVQRGYVTFGSDGGHKSLPGNNWDASFSLNDEALRNFAGESLKKTKDAAAAIIDMVYGYQPEYVYFSGGSNGGREALKAIHDYPEDYDGAVIQFPVLNWVGKALLDNRNANFTCENKHRWISRDVYRKIQDLTALCLDKTDANGITLPVLFPNEEIKGRILAECEKILTKEQLAGFLIYGDDMQLPFELDNNINIVPGYGILEGCTLHDMIFSQLSSCPGERDGAMSQFGDAVIRYQIMRDASFDPTNFDYIRYQEKVQLASRLLDATSSNFDRFVERGGKIILLHGTSDQLVSMYSTIALYRSMLERYGDKLNDFLRFYLVPGYGHGMGEDFTLCFDLMNELEKWKITGIAPEDLEIEDQTPGHRNRRQTIHVFREQ